MCRSLKENSLCVPCWGISTTKRFFITEETLCINRKRQSIDKTYTMRYYCLSKFLFEMTAHTQCVQIRRVESILV